MTARCRFAKFRPMERTLLQQILQSAPGVQKTDGGFLIADEHRASIYLGQGGQATLLADLVRVTLHPEYLEAEAKDRTLHFVRYEPVIGLSLRRPRADVPRTGF